jgi:hypothetical protein
VSALVHLFVDTPEGTLVKVVVACVVVAVLVWWAVNFAVALLVLGLWWLGRALQRLLAGRRSGWRHPDRPGATA